MSTPQTLPQLQQQKARMEEKEQELQTENDTTPFCSIASPSQSQLTSTPSKSQSKARYIRKKGDNSFSEENIRVVCRFRPINKKERDEEKTNRLQDYPIKYKKNNSTIIIPREEHKGDLKFTLDRFLKPKTSQDDVFKIVGQPLVEQVITGYNCTIIAYGQTGSGKTFTMFGPENNVNVNVKVDKLSELGIIPRSVDYLFNLLNTSNDIINFRVSVSIIEIYKEVSRDLLDNVDTVLTPKKSNININITIKGSRKIKNRSKKRLEIFTSGKETMIKNLIEWECNNIDDVLKCIYHGQNNRKVRKHKFIGHDSSRSHCFVIINVLQRLVDDTLKQSKLNFGDLGGSELASKTGGSDDVLKEAGRIHQGLLALEKVIFALAEKRSHIPYCDSKLTKVLSDSLGGNSKTALVVTCSPSIWNRV